MSDIRKGVYILPNLFTTASLFCGFYAIIEAIRISSIHHPNFGNCAIAVLLAALFDGMDGRVARKTHTSSKFGMEYDSLADLVSFGVAPATIVWLWSLRDFDRFGWTAAFVYLACGALRLARFNVQAGGVEKKSFQGIPIPMAAMMMMGSILIWDGGPPRAVGNFNALEVRFVNLLLTYLVAILMVSTIPYRSFKTLQLTRRLPFYVLVFFVVALVFWAYRPWWALYLLGCAYLLSGPIEKYIIPPPVAAFQQVKKRRRMKKTLQKIDELVSVTPTTATDAPTDSENVHPLRRP